ncbi:MAG TPA: hypothetical protein VLB44_26850 [Kofleriaceae bacterium]|nr:hypothetical protein [Kofleriaceae bacterium]
MTRATVQVTVVKVLAALALLGSGAHAEAPVRAAASDHGGAKAAPRTQSSTVKPRSTPKLAAPVTPAPKTKLVGPVAKGPVAKAPAKLSAPVASNDDAADDDEIDASETTTTPAPLTVVEGKPMTAPELMVEYQRIGRDLKKLQDLRGTECTLELWSRFRAIKLDEMCKKPESRLELESELRDLRAKIERKRGVELSADCLNNPLAANCQ